MEPVFSVKLPIGHGKQAEDPTVAEKDPIEQTRQFEEPNPSTAVPRGQGIHDDMASTGLKVPGPHGWQ